MRLVSGLWVRWRVFRRATHTVRVVGTVKKSKSNVKRTEVREDKTSNAGRACGIADAHCGDAKREESLEEVIGGHVGGRAGQRAPAVLRLGRARRRLVLAPRRLPVAQPHRRRLGFGGFFPSFSSFIFFGGGLGTLFYFYFFEDFLFLFC